MIAPKGAPTKETSCITPRELRNQRKTLPVQNMRLGFTEMHVLNRPIFGFYGLGYFADLT